MVTNQRDDTGWIGCPEYVRIVQAEMYYRNLTEIKDKKFLTKFTDRDYRTNCRMRSGIFGHIVNQRRDYVLAKPFTCDHEQIKKEFSMYELRRAATDYVSCGVMVIGLNKDGKFKRYPPESVTSDNKWVGVDAITPLLKLNDGNAENLYEGVTEKIDKPVWFTRLVCDEPCLFDTIKEYVDAYEILFSRKQDALADMPNSPIVVKGYLDDPDQFINRVREDGVIYLSKDGACDEMRVRTDYTEINAQLDRLKQCIYDIGCAVDMAVAVIGNTSSVALRLLYVDLESKAYQLADTLFEAIKRTLEVNNFGLSQKEIEDLNISWNFNAIVNENDEIMNCVQSQNLISLETMLSHNPWVTNVKEEIDRLSSETVFGDESSTDDSQEIRLAARALLASKERGNREDVSRMVQAFVQRNNGGGGTTTSTIGGGANVKK